MPVPSKSRTKVVLTAWVAGLAWLVWFLATPPRHRPGIQGVQIKAMNEAKQVGIAAKLYANDHEGRLPETFAQLMPDIVDDARLFQQMQLLTPGAKLDELPPKTVMMTKTFMKATWAFSIPWGKQERMVLVYPDLSVHVKQ